MRIYYNEREDLLKIELSDKPIKESDTSRNDIILNYGFEGSLVSMEILSASAHVSNPKHIEYEITK